MPVPATSRVPAPESEDEFDKMVGDALRIRFGNAYLVRFGRRGQAQHGIDGFDPVEPRSRSTVWQSTLQEQNIPEKIDADLAKLDADDRGQPALFVIVLGVRRDAPLHHFQDLSAARARAGQCRLLLLFWEDIYGELCCDIAIARKWFPALYAPEERAEVPLRTEDHLLLAALVEYADLHDDGSDAWMPTIDAAVRTGLSAKALNESMEILHAAALLEARPYGPGERGASRFSHQGLQIRAKGQRALREGTPPSLQGPVLPPIEYVPLNYPDLNKELVLAEQRQGFAIEWQPEGTLPDLLRGGAELVTTEINRRMARLVARDRPGNFVLVRRKFRERTPDEVLALIKQQGVSGAYLQQQDNEWVVKQPTPLLSPLGGPPVSISMRVIARGVSFWDILADLRILVRD